MEAPQNPAGAFVLEERCSPDRRASFIATIDAAPVALRNAIAGLTEDQLDTRYRNWTLRQIVHHLADSHVHAYVRFKLALTEDVPTIKPYDEGQWVALDDSLLGDIQAPLAFLEGTHTRWVQSLRSLKEEQFQRQFYNPESKKTWNLSDSLCYYSWHCRHHTEQIIWLRRQHDW